MKKLRAKSSLPIGWRGDDGEKKGVESMRKLWEERRWDPGQALIEKFHSSFSKHFILSCQREIVTLFHRLF